MSDIDSDDYVDVGENVLADDCNDNVDAVVTEKSGGKGRGRDIEWIEVERFSEKTMYENSPFYLDIKTNFTLRRARECEFSDTENFTCKFSR